MTDSPRRVRVLACGGTFDKRYDPLTGQLVFEQTQLDAVVRRARVTVPVSIETVMLVDSLDMTEAHRARVLAACRAAQETALVITHGTDTMPETARTLGPHFGTASAAPDGGAKTLVLTGAMVPYAFSQSDALFNLGFAFACAQTLAPGVYIAMNGRVFAWDAVRKNREGGVFETT